MKRKKRERQSSSFSVSVQLSQCFGFCFDFPQKVKRLSTYVTQHVLSFDKCQSGLIAIKTTSINSNSRKTVNKQQTHTLLHLTST